jgi:hypothetical protein
MSASPFHSFKSRAKLAQKSRRKTADATDQTRYPRLADAGATIEAVRERDL